MSSLASLPQHAPPQRDLHYETFELAPITTRFGAEVRGIDLSRPLGSAENAEIRRAWRDWMVLVFRDQKLTHEQHKAFGRNFGTLHVHPLMRKVETGHPEILYVNSGFTTRIKDLSTAESRAILDLLFRLVEANPTNHLSRQMGAGHPDVLGQSMHAAPRDLGLLSENAAWGARVDRRRRATEPLRRRSLDHEPLSHGSGVAPRGISA